MSIKKNIKQFWTAFSKEEANLRLAFAKGEHESYVEELVGLSQDLFGLAVEIESDGSFFELSFLPILDKNLQLIAQTLKDQAPKELVDFWIINAYRQPLSDKAFHTYVPVGEEQYHYDAFQVEVSMDETTKTFALEVQSPAFNHLDEANSQMVANQMLQYFVGDLYLQAYISAVSVKAIDAMQLHPYSDEELEELLTETTSLPFVALEQLFEVLAFVVDQKEWPTYHSLLDIYHVFKLEEERISETIRHDMLFITTTHEQLISESLRDETQAAGEFFDLGGEYGYFVYRNKYEGENNALLKQTLEKQLQSLLYPLGIARVIGGAIGVNYTYLDVAVFDKPLFIKALAKIQDKLSMEIDYHSFL
ncbi:MAG: hypothetical protein ACRCZJ_01690 [Erysipelotrichaceae bacterium]